MIVLWRVTERCNLACGFCAYDRRVRRGRKSAEVETVLRFAQVLGDWQRRSGERVLLSWLGGEPLHWPPLFALAAQVRRDTGIALSVTSNGSTLHRPGEIDRIVEAFDEFTVSVDGFAALHDALRGQAGLFDRVRDGVRSLHHARRERGAALKLRANIVLMRDNLADFTSLCEALADWGIDEITFNALGGRDRPEFFPDHGLRLGDIAVLRQALPPLRAWLAARGVRLLGSAAYLQRFEASARGDAIPVADCAGHETFLFIDERGRVSPCSFTGDEYGISVDELRSVEELMALRGRFETTRRKHRALACGDCPSTHVFAKFAKA